jgi:hypothetical protein
MGELVSTAPDTYANPDSVAQFDFHQSDKCRMFDINKEYVLLLSVCVLQYLSSSHLTLLPSLGDQSRGDGGVSSDEEELNAPFRVTSV